MACFLIAIGVSFGALVVYIVISGWLVGDGSRK